MLETNCKVIDACLRLHNFVVDHREGLVMDEVDKVSSTMNVGECLLYCLTLRVLWEEMPMFVVIQMAVSLKVEDPLLPIRN